MMVRLYLLALLSPFLLLICMLKQYFSILEHGRACVGTLAPRVLPLLAYPWPFHLG